MNKKPNSCCFTGHRTIDGAELTSLEARLAAVIERLIASGVCTFYCGGALGFDMLAGFCVLEAKRRHPEVELVMALPCRDQDRNWAEADRARYRELIARCDRVVYLADAYEEGCMLRRNRYMVSKSGVCVAYMRRPRSGTGQTVRLAKGAGRAVINLAHRGL